MINKIIVINGNPENSFEAITLTGNALYKEGCVKENFINACIEREKNFPTGLPTEIGVAIPHCDAINVIEPAICVLRPDKPVLFEDMGGGVEPIKCQIIMNLALHKQEDQVVLLRRIINTIQDVDTIKLIKDGSEKEVIELLMNKLEND